MADQISHTHGQFTHTPINRVSSPELHREGARPTSLSAAASKGDGPDPVTGDGGEGGEVVFPLPSPAQCRQGKT